MSHFTVAVITDDPNKLEEMLAPYNENEPGEKRVYKTAEEVKADYEEIKERIRSGKDEYWSDKEERGQRYLNYSLDEFIEAYYGIEEDMRDPDGTIYTTYNQNSKWDWYEEGGRWSGLLMLKDGTRVNRARIGDVYFHGLTAVTEEDMVKEDDDIAELIRSIRGEPPQNMTVVEKIIADRVKALDEEWEDITSGKSFYKPEYYIERYKTKERYINLCLRTSTYAVLDQNGWHEPGKMGWFGMTSAEPEQEGDWDEKYYERFIRNANPDHFIIIVDCHI